MDAVGPYRLSDIDYCYDLHTIIDHVMISSGFIGLSC